MGKDCQWSQIVRFAGQRRCLGADLAEREQNHTAMTRGLPQQTSGMTDPKADTFADVRRALNAWLMSNDSKYQEASEQARERNLRSRKYPLDLVKSRHGIGV